LARGFDHQHFGLQRQRSRLAEKHECLGWIAYDHAHHCVIDGVGCSQRVNVNFCFRQRFTHARKGPGTICKKHCELGGRFDGERWVHAAFNVMPGMAPDNLGKSEAVIPPSL
jgi:hypothetical protein